MASRASEWAARKQELERTLAEHLQEKPTYQIPDSHGGAVHFVYEPSGSNGLYIKHQEDASPWETPNRDHLLALARWILATFGDQEGR